LIITLGEAGSLDSKHTIIGEMLELSDPILAALEQLPVDKINFKPIEALAIVDVIVVENPFEGKEDKNKNFSRPPPLTAAAIRTTAAGGILKTSKSAPGPSHSSRTIGKYLNR
jgi:hypothetical protein